MAPGCIYRNFDFCNLVSLHMLGTRLVGRDRQIDITEMAGSAGPTAQAAAAAAFSSATRQLLGSEQLAWLSGRTAASTVTWQVLGQQVLMARMELPISVLAALNTSDTSPEALAGDTHNAWHSELTLMGLANPALAGVKVDEEFATSSVGHTAVYAAGSVT